MKDKISQARVALLHPLIRGEVVSLIDKAEVSLGKYAAIRVVQSLRTFAEQDALYAQGRTKPGPKVTNAKGGQSIHNYGLALDFALLYDKDKNGTFEALSWDTILDRDQDKIKDWIEVVNVFKAGGYIWGGNWTSIRDYPHFEKTYGKGWRDLLKLYTAGKFISGTRYLDSHLVSTKSLKTAKESKRIKDYVWRPI